MLPIMGTYTDPNQLATDVAAQAQTLGSSRPSVKDALAQARVQAQLYSPYYKSLLGVNNHAPAYDLTPSVSWSDGLNKGLNNVLSGINHRQQVADDTAALENWQTGIQQQQAAQQQAAQQSAMAAAQEQAAQREHIRQTQGDEAAFAFDLNPKKFGEAAGAHYGELPTVLPTAQAHALGTAIGQGQGHIQQIQGENQYLANQGLNFGDANRGVWGPQASNLYTRVTGQHPIDMLDATKRVAETQQAQQQAVAGTINNQTLGARNDNEVTGGSLRNQGQATENQIKNIELGFKAANEKAALNEKYLTQQDKAESMAKRQKAEMLLNDVTERMKHGEGLTPSDASRLDQTFKAAGINTDFLGDIKKITNVKGGQALTNEKVQRATGAKGWVTLPSGKQYNPATGQVTGGGSQPKPKKVSALPSMEMPLTELLPYGA